MKKYLSTSFALLLGFGTVTASYPVCDNPPETDSEERKAPVGYPQIVFGDFSVSILTPQIMYNVEIIIKDSNGNMLYYEVLEELNYTYTIQFGEENFGSMYSIELIYGDHHLYGYFV